MLIRRLIIAACLLFVLGTACAQVDANHGDQAALDGIKGLGPTTSKAIIAERKENGKFRDWRDFESRVKGIGEKKAVQLSRAGLTVNGQPKPGLSSPSGKR